MKDLANTYFHGAERYNCAQAVLKSAEKFIPVDEKLLKEFRKAGGGRARDGMCGALFSAKKLIGSETDKQRARHTFSQVAGSTRCREIKKEGRMSCRECVMTAAELAEKSLNKTKGNR